MKKLILSIFLLLNIYSCNNFYYGVDNIKENFEKNKRELIFLKESAKEPNNIISTVSWNDDMLHFRTVDGKFYNQEDFYRLYGENDLTLKQIKMYKELNLKFFSLYKTGAKFFFKNTGKCIHLMGTDSIDYNDFDVQVRINRYKNGEKTGWIIPLDAHWYIYTDCD